MTAIEGNQFLLCSRELAEGAFREVALEAEGRPVWLVVTRHKGTPKAWLNVCPHAGRALNWAPDRFLTDDQGRLVCSAHGAVFEPGNGSCVAGPCRGAALTAIDVVEREGAVRTAG
jgi:nitrite reductase/ring-hydroxylating ferredoxin subunit